MKKFLSIIAFSIATLSLSAQNFEGKVTYQNTYTSKIPGVSDKSLGEKMGTLQEYYIRGGDYKSVINGTFLQWQLYINRDNKLYNKIGGSETIFWYDGTKYDDSLLKVHLNKNFTTILGYKCDELTLTCKKSIQKYYFSPSLGVDTKLYVNHKFGNWYDYLKWANAVPLKIIVQYKDFDMTCIATEVKPVKLTEKDFQLPANAKTAKSPF